MRELQQSFQQLEDGQVVLKAFQDLDSMAQ